MWVSHRLWLLGFLLLAMLPAGARVLTWGRARPLIAEASAARAGEMLFKHEWKPRDPLCPTGDGLGPVYNATSCVACHHQGGTGGAGGRAFNVTTFTVRPPIQGAKPREGVVHAFGLGVRDTLADVDRNLPALSQPTLEQLVNLPGRQNHCLPFPAGTHISQRNTPALFGGHLIDAIPERDILAGERYQSVRWGMATSERENIPVGRAIRLADGRLGRFGWKAQSPSLGHFVRGACANELGLGNPGQAQPRPLSQPKAPLPGLDLTDEQCDQMVSYIASLPRPVEKPSLYADMGKAVFTRIGCADCHTPNLGSVEGLYSDLLVHRMGQELVGGGSYNEPPVPLPDGEPGEGPSPSEWRTPPLWGVADSAPYLHDGRATTLTEAIRMHGGQGARAAQRFDQLSAEDRGSLLAFLESLRAP